MMAAYHKSNLGSFGGGLVVDLDGYTYTTAEEWLSKATLDAAVQADLEADEDYAEEWAEEQADKAIAALARAEAGVAEWQERNA